MFPFPSAPEPSKPGQRPPAGMTPVERGRMVLLGVSFLFVLGLVVGLYMYSVSGKPAAPERPSEPLPAPVGPVVEFKSEPLFPEEEAEEVQKLLQEKLAAFPHIAQGVPAVDPAAYDFLLDECTLNARVLNLLSEGFDPDPDAAKILEDPGAHLGRLLRVSGDLLSLERTKYEGGAKGVQEVRRGLVRDGKGRLYSFSWPVTNPLEPVPVEPGKGWVRLHGILYKSWPVEDPAAPGKPVPSLHIVLQRRPQPDYPALDVRDIDPAWMEQVRDAAPADMVVRDEDPLFYLLNLVKNLGPEGFDGWLRAKDAADPGLKLHPPEDFTGRYRDLLDRPELHRFRPVRYIGFLAKPTELSDVRPNPGNVERLWVGFLVDDDFVPGVWVYSPRSITAQGLKAGDRVRVEGIFLKRVAYQPAGGGPMCQAAVIVAGRILPAPLPERGFAAALLLGILLLMLLLAGGLVYFMAQSRKEEISGAERRMERLARRRKAAEAAAPSAPGDAPPPAVPPGPPSPGGGGSA